MSIYNDNINSGNFYVRKIDGQIDTSNSFLSSIYIKYENINNFFYNDLIDNRIKNIDVLYDVIFIETRNGYIFEKILTDDDNKIYPYNNNNLFTPIINTSPSFWFDDKKLVIYIADVIYGEQTSTSFNFFISIKEFDCKSGKLFSSSKDQIIFNCSDTTNWGNFTPTLEQPKFSFNENTKNFNLSFIFRNKQNNIGIVSANFSHLKVFNLDKINLYSDFLKVSNSYHISL